MALLAIEIYMKHDVPIEAGFTNYFSKLFADFRKLDLSQRLLEKLLSFSRFLARRLILQLYGENFSFHYTKDVNWTHYQLH